MKEGETAGTNGQKIGTKDCVSNTYGKLTLTNIKDFTLKFEMLDSAPYGDHDSYYTSYSSSGGTNIELKATNCTKINDMLTAFENGETEYDLTIPLYKGTFRKGSAHWNDPDVIHVNFKITLKGT